MDKAIALTYLRGAVRDMDDCESRSKLGHCEMFIPDRIETIVYPVRLAREKIVYSGASSVPILLTILQDKSESLDVRRAAARSLANFDDPSVRDSILDGAKSGQLEVEIAVEVLNWGYLVNWSRVGRDCPDSGQSALKEIERLGGLNRTQCLLDELDFTMAADLSMQGLNEIMWDYRIMVWLDMIYDYSLTEHLREHAPRAMEFRDRQLKKGYDPVLAFDESVYVNLRDGYAALFESPRDRIGCLELLEVIYETTSPLHPKAEKGWPDRVRSWYSANRSKLCYDYGLHRLVVKEKGPAQSSPPHPIKKQPPVSKRVR